MDKVKIGKFISACRKEKQITQEQLAEMLHVTDKSVSKWENGICLPDASLYEPLCKNLDISINELFAGQRIADVHLLQMLKRKMYSMSDKSVSFADFDNALDRIAEVTMILKAFESKEEAVQFLVRESGASCEECSKAYDFYIHLFDTNEEM